MAWPLGYGARFQRAVKGAQQAHPEAAVAKHPLTPSMGLQQWLQAVGPGAKLQARTELVLTALMMFLGWRSVVLTGLTVGDLEWLPARDCLAVVRRTDKQLQPDRARPRAYVSFPRLPQLHRLLRATVSELHSTLPADGLLLAWLAGPRASASAMLLGLFRACFGNDVSSHCARVGCATSLLNVGVSPALVKAHIDWAETSATWRTYFRPGWPVAAYDIDFFWAAMPVCIQRMLA